MLKNTKPVLVILHNVLIYVPVRESLHGNAIAEVVGKPVLPDDDVAVIYIVALRIDTGPVVEKVVIFYQDVLAQTIQRYAVILPTVCLQ